jgi:hypothetical protein
MFISIAWSRRVACFLEVAESGEMQPEQAANRAGTEGQELPDLGESRQQSFNEAFANGLHL